MNTKKVLAVLVVALFCSTSAWAITITPGNPGNQDTDNVLFNDSNLQHMGTLVQGNFNGSGSGFVVDFTSTSGNGELIGDGGQATITGGMGNDPFTNLSFMLENGATFTKAILNPDVSVDGMIHFTVMYIDPVGTHMEDFMVDGSGNNFFGVMADGTEKILKVTFDVSGTDAVNASQFRLGGFEPFGVVPDNGATIALLGAALVAIEVIRRTVAERAPAK